MESRSSGVRAAAVVVLCGAEVVEERSAILNATVVEIHPSMRTDQSARDRSAEHCRLKGGAVDPINFSPNKLTKH
jgi:hypothetical protein